MDDSSPLDSLCQLDPEETFKEPESAAETFFIRNFSRTSTIKNGYRFLQRIISGILLPFGDLPVPDFNYQYDSTML